MDDTSPLYNSRIIKIFLEFLGKNYPDIDINAILEFAEMTKYEVEDTAHWFNQRQVDRFNEILVQMTGNPHIAKDAGRYATSSEGIGPIRQYALGLMTLTSIYQLMRKVHAIMSRAVDLKARKTGPNTVEIITKPKLGVIEKSYQCENRIGTFESIGRLFTDKFAKIDHPLCVHKGDDYCRYLISWEKNPSIIWKQVSNILLALAILTLPTLFFFLSKSTWLAVS